MENKKDIGKAFREKLDGLQKPAPDGGWDSISSQLGQIKKPSKFPWLRTTIVSLLLIFIIALATYPFWEKHVPRVYIESPGENTNGGSDNASANGQPESSSPENNATGPQNSSTTGDTENDSPLPDGGKPVNTVATSIGKTTDKQDPAMSYESIADGKSHRPANTDNTSTTLPVIGNSNVAETNTVKGTGNIPDKNTPDYRRGKLKDPTDYGADSLVIKKRPEKRDFSKIADSLNQLYGKVERIRLSFNIPANLNMQPGNKTFYIQILDPNNKVVNEKTIDIPGSHTLSYSLTTDVLYENKAITINEAVTGRGFARGVYRVNVFDKDRLLTSTTFTFK